MSARKKLQPKDYANKKEKAEEDRAAFQSRLSKALNKTFGTTEGKLVLNYLAKDLGFYDTSINVIQNGDILPMRTIYNEARRNVYLDLRNKIDHKIVQEAENLIGGIYEV